MESVSVIFSPLTAFAPGCIDWPVTLPARLNTFSTNADFLRYKNIYMLFKIDFEGSLRKYLVNYKELVGEKSPISEVLLKDERGK